MPRPSIARASARKSVSSARRHAPDGWPPRWAAMTRWGCSTVFIDELDQVHLLARAVPGGFEQINHARESGSPREFWRDVVQRDLPHARHANETVLHRVTSAELHLRPLPDADGTADLAARDRRAQPLQEAEAHERSRMEGCSPHSAQAGSRRTRTVRKRVESAS